MAARDFLQDDRPARPAIFTLVVAAHLAVLLAPWDERIRAIDGATRSTLLLIPQRIDIRPRLSPDPAVEISAVNVDAPSPPSLAPMYLPTETPTGSAMAPPDWKQSGAEAAADAARDNYRALGPRPAEPGVKLPASPFAPPPRHKFGETDVDEQRNPILWLSDHCWLRPRNFAAQPGDPFAAIPMTFCSYPFGRKEPRGDLFDHLRKTPPVP
ncbi:hypothetical protein GCM10011487_36280 [Steroidobacter agaridevorans]|uniref:Uncharacterized protein n=1 Tax=Steroidobacter agaridevorans TaxID=2695856 RepID=A0A829YFK7_9GAMM|nr:hypothetical protein [Steroidobacter agaridevorans]GFE81628.1 hypothetical protein GCM10011487_36280 [Steroidobacter agaridevorans]